MGGSGFAVHGGKVPCASDVASLLIPPAAASVAAVGSEGELSGEASSPWGSSHSRGPSCIDSPALPPSGGGSGELSTGQPGLWLGPAPSTGPLLPPGTTGIKNMGE